MTGHFSHFAKCLVTQTARNICTVERPLSDPLGRVTIRLDNRKVG